MWNFVATVSYLFRRKRKKFMFKKVLSYFIIFCICFNQAALCGRKSHQIATDFIESDPLLTSRGLPSINQEDEEEDSSSFEEALEPRTRRNHLTPLQEIGSEDTFRDGDRSLNIQLIDWIDKDILNSTNTLGKCSDGIISGIGVFSGLSIGALCFMLGYDLAMRVVHLTQPEDIVLSSFYGIGVAAPMTVLGLSSSGEFIKNLLQKKSIREKEVEISRGMPWKIMEVGTKAATGIVSLIAASTITYLTYSEFNDYIGWFWLVPGIPNYYTRAAMDYIAIPIAAKTLYNEIRSPIDRYIGKKYPGGRSDNITFIKDKLENASNYICSFTDEQAMSFLNLFLNAEDTIDEITMFTKPELFENIEKIKKINTWGRKIVGAIGVTIGTIGLWVYLPLTQDAFRTILSPAFSSGEVWPQLVDGLAYTALISSTAIVSRASGSSATMFYDYINKLTTPSKSQPEIDESPSIKKCCTTETKRTALAVVSVLLAAWNASQVIEVVLDFPNTNKFVTAFSLAAMLFTFFSLSFWTVNGKFSSHLQSSDPRTPFLNKINLLNQKVYEIADDSLGSLRSFLNSNN